jgi:hypothetical protein
MPKYRVIVPEVHYSHRVIEADNADDAVEEVQGGGGDEVECTYAFTLEPDHQFGLNEHPVDVDDYREPWGCTLIDGEPPDEDDEADEDDAV